VTPQPTYYEATAAPLPAFPALNGDRRVNVCVIGGGFTGLGAALALREHGLGVIVLEQGRIASGASGRNGGQIHSGLRRDQITLERQYGMDEARRLWDLGQAAIAHIDALIARHGIACERREGMIYADHRARFVPASHEYARHLRTRYGYDAAEPLSRDELRALVRSDDYHGGMLDRGGGHLHPLQFARGVAHAAVALGAELHEGTKALSITAGLPAMVVTATGTVTADWVIVAGDSLMKGLVPEADARILPIASTVAVTEPLGDQMREVLTTEMAVADSRHVVNYYRPTSDGRLLFGGGESYSSTHVADPGKMVRAALANVFPGLRDVQFAHAWSGIVGVTSTRLPMVRRLQPNVLLAAGYSGQGVALAPFAGRVLADAIAQAPEAFETLSRLQVPPFPGGTALRHPLLVLAMLYYAARDRF
jgi:gamma-glutamylputrescine oxidase